MTLRHCLILALVALLAACSSNGPRYLIDPVQSDLKLRPAVGSAVVRTVSLPAYAAADEIAVQAAGGEVVSLSGKWADTPERAITLTLARHLSGILGTTVAPEPWPLDGLPDVGVDIRVERLLADESGTFRLSGVYFIGGEAVAYRGRSQQFDIALPLGETGPAAIAAAQANALKSLAEQIARSLSR